MPARRKSILRESGVGSPRIRADGAASPREVQSVDFNSTMLSMGDDADTPSPLEFLFSGDFTSAAEAASSRPASAGTQRSTAEKHLRKSRSVRAMDRRRSSLRAAQMRLLQQGRARPQLRELTEGEDLQISAPAMRKFEAFFWADMENVYDLQSELDVVYRAYVAARTRSEHLDENLTDALFTDFAVAAGWCQLTPAVLQRVSTAARLFVSSRTDYPMTFKAFVRGLLVLIAITSRSDDLQSRVFVQTFRNAVESSVSPYLSLKVEGWHRVDVRRNQGIDDLLYVYWVPIQRTFLSVAKYRPGAGGISNVLKSKLDDLLEHEEWLSFANESGLSRSLTRWELARIAKLAQMTDKDGIVDFRIPADTKMLGRTYLDLPEFMNALVRCALAIHRHAPQEECPDAEHKVASLLHSLFSSDVGRFSVPKSELLYGIPGPPVISSVSPQHGQSSEATRVTIVASPMCLRRGVWMRIPGVAAKLPVVVLDRTSVMAEIPPLPPEARITEPAPAAVAARAVWAKAERRRLDREQHLRNAGHTRDSMPLSPRSPSKVDPVLVARPFPPPIDVALRVDARVENTRTVISYTTEYTVDLQLSNNGRDYGCGEGSIAEFTYEEEGPTAELPAALVDRLRQLFVMYCRHEDPYNDSIMTLTKWLLFKKHFGVVEVSSRIYAPLRKARYQNVVRTVELQEKLLHPDKVLKGKFQVLFSTHGFGKLPSLDLRRARAEVLGLALDDPVPEGRPPAERLMHLPGADLLLAPDSEPEPLPGKPGYYNVDLLEKEEEDRTHKHPIFESLSVVSMHRGQSLVGVTFPRFLALMCRLFADLLYDLDPAAKIEALLEAGHCSLPKPSKTGFIDTTLALNAKKLIGRTPRRRSRLFAVCEGPLVAGVLSEQPGCVDNARHRLCSWESVVGPSAAGRVVQLLNGALCPESFEAILLALRARDLLLAPVGSLSVHSRQRVIRCYELVVTGTATTLGDEVVESGAMRTARRLRSILQSAKRRAAAVARLDGTARGSVTGATPLSDGVMDQAVDAADIAGHLWDTPGTCATLWWQPADGDALHPECTMMVYGSDPTQHFHRIFPIFYATKTAAELRGRLMEVGYELWPKRL